MAVSIDTVYQRVLAIVNKEQRGYITPLEFNLLANQAQMEIFEQYFYEINQFNRLPGNTTEYSDMRSILEEKLSPFQRYMQDVSVASSSVGTLPSDVYRLGTLMYVGGTYPVEVEEISHNQLLILQKSPLTRATTSRPYYIRLTGSTVELYPTGGSGFASSNDIRCNYTDKPILAKWGYTIVNDQALYNATTATDFELHASEETTLVIKVLELAGITMKDQGLMQVADKEEVETTQQEKL
jgi:hypothetical protein